MCVCVWRETSTNRKKERKVRGRKKEEVRPIQVNISRHVNVSMCPGHLFLFMFSGTQIHTPIPFNRKSRMCGWGYKREERRDELR